MTADVLATFLRPATQPNLASGRVHEFRMVGGKLQMVGPDGRWQPYVPFAAIR
jgi:hypothetical protein